MTRLQKMRVAEACVELFMAGWAVAEIAKVLAETEEAVEKNIRAGVVLDRP